MLYYGQVENAPTQSDEAVALSVQKGDTEQFGILVERYEQKLLRYGRKFLSRHEDIQDIVQDVFLSAYENMQSFDTSKTFSPWIYRIAHNAFVNKLRKNSRNPLVLVDFDTLISHPVYEDPDNVEREREEIKRLINRGLERLEPKYREVLILYYLEELPYKEIADILEIPTGTVGVRLKRGRAALKEMYKDMGIEYGD